MSLPGLSSLRSWLFHIGAPTNSFVLQDRLLNKIREMIRWLQPEKPCTLCRVWVREWSAFLRLCVVRGRSVTLKLNISLWVSGNSHLSQNTSDQRNQCAQCGRTNVNGNLSYGSVWSRRSGLISPIVSHVRIASSTVSGSVIVFRLLDSTSVDGIEIQEDLTSPGGRKKYAIVDRVSHLKHSISFLKGRRQLWTTQTTKKSILTTIGWTKKGHLTSPVTNEKLISVQKRHEGTWRTSWSRWTRCQSSSILPGEYFADAMTWCSELIHSHERPSCGELSALW
jgi:hypothetical protein